MIRSATGESAVTPALSVTVVVCAYNYAHYLPAALDSVLAQTYPAELIELLVVDDGSTDDTPEVLAGYGDRVRVLRQENAGLNAATERGIRAATGDLVAILDADDIWKPEKLARQVALFDGRPEVGLVFSDVEIIDADGRTTDPSHFGKHGMQPPRGRALGTFLQENFAPAPSIVFRRELAGHVLPFASEASFQDWWLALRVAEVAELDWVEASLVRYRVHGGNMAAGAGVDAGSRTCARTTASGAGCCARSTLRPCPPPTCSRRGSATSSTPRWSLSVPAFRLPRSSSATGATLRRARPRWRRRSLPVTSRSACAAMSPRSPRTRSTVPRARRCSATSARQAPVRHSSAPSARSGPVTSLPPATSCSKSSATASTTRA